jgi:hypothetical protein
MINDVLVMLRDKLNDYCRLKTGSSEDKVVFPDGADLDPAGYPINSVIPILVNFEEEKNLRAANRFDGTINNGIKTGGNPAIALNLMVLFVVRFSDYEQTMKFLSLIIKFFQRNAVYDQQNTPSLNPEISKLRMELLTLSFSERNELWNSLGGPYQPSVLYKISLLVFHDDESMEVSGHISEVQTNFNLQ